MGTLLLQKIISAENSPKLTDNVEFLRREVPVSLKHGTVHSRNSETGRFEVSSYLSVRYSKTTGEFLYTGAKSTSPPDTSSFRIWFINNKLDDWDTTKFPNLQQTIVNLMESDLEEFRICQV